MNAVFETAKHSKYPLANVIRAYKQHYPDLWSLACPRIYKGVEEFHDFRLPPALRLGSFLAQQIQPDLREKHLSNFVFQDICTMQQQPYGFPTYFIERKLVRALVQTDLPPVVDWMSMPFPFPGFTVILPRKCLYTDGEEIAYFECAKVPAGSVVARDGERTTQDLLVILASLASGAMIHRKMHKPYTASEFQQTTHADSEPLTSDDLLALDDITRIFFNCLYVMAARPEYVERGQRTGTHKKSGAELWEPNIIGRKYATKRDPNTEAGTHASPRMHWRRGHFRHQPFGSGRTENKIIWIEPMLVNAKVVDAR